MNSSIITSHLHTSFRKIGAFVEALPVPTGSRRAPGEVRRRISVRDRTTDLRCRPTRWRSCPTVAPTSAISSCACKIPAPSRSILCGLDERHWFVAAVTGTTVPAAKDSLMPRAVREVAERAGRRHADFHRRHTSFNPRDRRLALRCGEKCDKAPRRRRS